jgi:hypothetical protein
MRLPKAKKPATALHGEPASNVDLLGGGVDCNYSVPRGQPQAVRVRAVSINAETARRGLQIRGYVPDEPRRATLADIERMLDILPYGRWIARDGRTIIFNRRYSPIWERLPDGSVQRANSNEWVDWVAQGWFDHGSMRYEKTAREAYRKVLRDFFDGKPLTVKDERRRAAEIARYQRDGAQ